MTDVVLGAFIGVVAAIVGAVVQGRLAQSAQVSAEERAERRRDRERLVESRFRALDQAHRMMAIGAEYARASAVGERADQVGHLRQQTESSNFLEADVTLLGDPELVSEYLERTRWWLTQPKGVEVRPSDLALDADLSNRLQRAFRLARERVSIEL